YPRLEELRAAFAALAEDLAEIGVAAGRRGAPGDMVQTDRNCKFRTQAKRFACLALRQVDAAAQVLASHVEERIGRLQDVDIRQVRVAFGEDSENITGE